MKIAVIGNGPVGLEIALEFLQEGADVRLLGRGFPASKIHQMSEILDWNIESYLRDETLNLLGLNRNELKTSKDLWKKYYLAIISYLNDHQVFYDREVLRVQKRFLDPEETIKDHSRLYDLFRVTYALNPSGMVQEQLNENPELKEKLTDDILSSLQHSIESFEDFDLVFDTRGPFENPHFMGPGKLPALNEERIGQEGDILYGSEAFKSSDFEKFNTLTVVGSGLDAVFLFLKLTPWLEKEGKVLNLITTELSAFEKVLSDSCIHDHIKEKIKGIISKELKGWRLECEKVEEEILKWRDLPTHEKMKIPQPQFPAPRLRLFEGYSVTSVDKLMDREGVYLTLEIPEWRSSEKKELVTLAQDRILVANGLASQENALESGFRRNLNQEPGFFRIRPQGHDLMNAACSLNQIPLIKSEVFKYFSKA